MVPFPQKPMSGFLTMSFTWGILLLLWPRTGLCPVSMSSRSQRFWPCRIPGMSLRVMIPSSKLTTQNLKPSCSGAYLTSYRSGVFDTDSSQTLFLYIDLKTSALPTYNKIMEHLEPLRSPINYLSSFEKHNGKEEVVFRPVTVILTGAAPFDEMMKNQTYRDVFYDAPISDLNSGKYTKFTSVTATGNFKSEVGGNGIPFLQSGALSEMEKARMKRQVEQAHSLGIYVRYWNLPSWPISWRNSIWHEVVKAGVDLLSVDDLKSASSFNW